MEQSQEDHFETKILFTEIDHEIVTELYQMLGYLGCKCGILSIIGSWKDTLPDSDILLMLKGANNDLKEELVDRLSL